MYLFDQIIPVVSNLEVYLLYEPIVSKNLEDCLNFTEPQLWREALFFHYDENKNFNILLESITINYLPNITKLLMSLILLGIKQDD